MVKITATCFLCMYQFGTFYHWHVSEHGKVSNNGGTLQYKSIRNQKYKYGKQQSSEYNCRFIHLNSLGLVRSHDRQKSHGILNGGFNQTLICICPFMGLDNRYIIFRKSCDLWQSCHLPIFMISYNLKCLK